MKLFTSPFSSFPLFIEMFFNDTCLSSGTGLVFEKEERFYLITNRHNFTGKDNFTGECLSNTASVPNRIKIHHHLNGSIKVRDPIFEDIITSDFRPLWIEHPVLKDKVDVVALELKNLTIDVPILPLNLYEETKFSFSVTSNVSVVGFPYGLSVENFPIWVTGSIASDPELDFNNLPLMLINCSTRQGMSGSPVIIYRNNGLEEIEGFGTRSIHAPCWRFIGIYSGRIATRKHSAIRDNESSDLGLVWKSSVINELLDSI